VGHITYWYYSNSTWVTSYIWNEALLTPQESYVRHYIRESHHIYEMELSDLLKKATCITAYVGHIISYVSHYIRESYHILVLLEFNVSHIMYMKWSLIKSSRKLRESLHTWVTIYIWNKAFLQHTYDIHNIHMTYVSQSTYDIYVFSQYTYEIKLSYNLHMTYTIYIWHMYHNLHMTYMYFHNIHVT